MKDSGEYPVLYHSEGECCGCGLCADVCPKKAIHLQPSGPMGHLYPVIDEEKCVKCGLCSRHCPASREQTPQLPKKCYAAWCEDESIRNGSSSGGIAAALYRHCLNNGYWATGTELTSDLHIRMKMTDSEADLAGFRGSKYAQAECTGVYRQSKQILKAGGKVLFAGTPCQCAAMRSMAEEAGSTGLVTVELICHGVPSQKVFHEYIQDIAQRKKRNVTDVAFRSAYGVELTLWDGDRVFWKRTGQDDPYLVGFQKGLLHREACYCCPYARPERASDLTIGDFWGIDSSVKDRLPKDCKASVLLVNTEKGEKLLSECSNLHLEERPYSEALNGNPNLNYPSRIHPRRAAFSTLFTEQGVYRAFRETVDDLPQRKSRLKRQTLRFAKQTAKQILPKRLQQILKNRKKHVN